MPSTIATRPLHDVLAQPDVLTAVRMTGAALRRLHEEPLPAGIGRAVHGPAQEAEALAAALEQMIREAPGAYVLIGERARVVLEQLAALRTPRRRRIHGALDPGQVVIGDAALAARDTVTAGDPVIDLATLAAGFHPPAAEGLREALLAGYGAPARWQRRMDIYEEAARLRLVCAGALRRHEASLAA